MTRDARVESAGVRMGHNHRSLLAALAAGVSFFAAAPAQDMSKNVPSDTDVAWAQRVAQSGAAEIRLAELARLRSPSQAVKDLAQRLSGDHGKALDELKQIAEHKGIKFAANPEEQYESLYQRLSNLKGLEFDKAYVTAMTEQLRLDVAEYLKQADTSGDPELKSFAIKTVSILQEDERLSQALLEQINTPVDKE